MATVNKKWIIKETNPVLKDIFARHLHISPLLAQILLNRGLFSLTEAAQFLYGDLSCLPDPFLFQDMDRAVERILLAVKRREKILVYGDYDADGITGTVLLVQALTQLGATVDFYVPHRLHEGYGLHLEPVKRAHAQGFTLVITVDCGISGAEVVAWAKNNRGPDFIITDHHQVPARLPAALAVINPKRTDCPYPFKELAGAGVALKLVQALFRERPAPGRPAWQDYLDLACLGTVADLVPLLGENRLLVKHGLPLLAGTKRPGLKALLATAGCPEEKLDTREISFGLAPRLNAMGRMGDAGQAVRLLLCPDMEMAEKMAAGLEEANQQRQAVEQTVLNEALQMLEEDPRQKQSRIILLARETFHPGVTGIVASRLVEIFYRPVMLVSLAKRYGKGSGRSIPGFHLYNALAHCRQHLLSYGGHAQAAGFTLEAGRLKDLAASLNEYARENLPDDLLVPQLELDGVTSLTEVTGQLVNELSLLLPFGSGNPEPVLGCLGATILRLREVGREGNHLKLFVKENGVFRDSIGFRLAGLVAPEIAAGKTVHLAFTPVLDQYNGKTRVQLELKDICPAEEIPDAGSAGSLPGQQMITAYPALAHASAASAAPASLPAFASLAAAEPAPAPVSAPASDPDFGKEPPVSLPEFAWSWFAAYARFPGRIFLPSRPSGSSAPAIREAAASLACPSPQAGSGRLDNLKITDLRNLPGKLARLANLSTGGRRTVILAGCPYQTAALASCLNETGARAAYFHSFLPNCGEDPLDSFQEGKVKTLVTTSGRLSQLPVKAPIEQLVIFHLPFSRQEWANSLHFATTARAEEIFLLFDEADRREMEHWLASLAPARDCLAYLYILLQHCQAKNKNIAHSLPELVTALRRKGLFWAGEHTVQVALAVFYELGLLKKDRQIYLTPAPAQKLDVRNSPTFTWGEKARKENMNWYAHVLTAPVKNLLADLPAAQPAT